MPTLYGPQFWEAGDFSWGVSPAYRSSAMVGHPPPLQTPITGYPELWAMENVHRSEGTGPAGQHTVDALDTADYCVSGVSLCGWGAEANGQWNVMGGGTGITWQWEQEFSTLAWASCNYAQLAFMGTIEGGSTAGYQFGSYFFLIECSQTTGNGFEWGFSFKQPNGSGGFNDPFVYLPASFAIDDVWRTIKLEIKPGTVLGAYAGLGSIGSAIVTADGYVKMYRKLSSEPDAAFVLEAERNNVPLVINLWATTQPELYFARGLNHGEASLVGRHTGDWVYYGSARQPMLRIS